MGNTKDYYQRLSHENVSFCGECEKEWNFYVSEYIYYTNNNNNVGVARGPKIASPGGG